MQTKYPLMPVNVGNNVGPYKFFELPSFSIYIREADCLSMVVFPFALGAAICLIL